MHYIWWPAWIAQWAVQNLYSRALVLQLEVHVDSRSTSACGSGIFFSCFSIFTCTVECDNYVHTCTEVFILTSQGDLVGLRVPQI